MAIENSVTTNDLEVMSSQTSFAYPSANSFNGGEINSEENIRKIVSRITQQSFVIKAIPTKDEPLYNQDIERYQIGKTFTLDTVSGQPSTLVISGGEANIKGYYFKNNQQTYINLLDFLGQDNGIDELYYNFNDYRYIDDSTGAPITMDYVLLYVYLNVKKDSVDHILSYDIVEDEYSNFRGVTVVLTNNPDNTNDLLLGHIYLQSDFSISQTFNNSKRFLGIDTDTIFAIDENNDKMSLYELIENYISDSKSGVINDNVTVFGNIGSITYIDLTDKSANNVLSLQYDPTNNNAYLYIYYPPNSEYVIQYDEKGHVIKTGMDNYCLASFEHLSKLDSDPSSLNIDVDNLSINDKVQLTQNGDDTSFNVNTDTVNITSKKINITDTSVNLNESSTIYFSDGANVGTEIGNGYIVSESIIGAVWA